MLSHFPSPITHPDSALSLLLKGYFPEVDWNLGRSHCGGAKRRFPAEFVKRSQFLGLEVVETLRQDFSIETGLQPRAG